MKKRIKTKKEVGLEDLAISVARGFANTATKKDLENLEKDMEEKFAIKQDLERFATKQDLENLGNRIDNSLEGFVRVFRGDYDELSSRVKRLEIAVFKR